MPEFRTHRSGPAIASTWVHANHQKTVFFESEWLDMDPLTLDSSRLTILAHPQPHKKGTVGSIWQITLAGRSNSGATAVVVRPGAKEVGTAKAGKKDPPPPVQLKVDVLPCLTLPDAKTDAGLFARVLLHETRTPAFGSNYNDADDLTVMNYMRNVLENRRLRRFDLFGFKSQPTLEDLLHQRGQFGGLGTYPAISIAEMKNVNDCLALANSDSDPRQPVFAKHVSNALAVAARPTAAPDPSPFGLYGWRTQDSSAPKGAMKDYTSVGGITFYTIDPDKAGAPIHGAKN